METMDQQVRSKIRIARAHLGTATGWNCRDDIQFLLCDALELLDKIDEKLKTPENF